MSLAAQAVFLASPSRRGLPLDDGWIHATYARNLARHGQLCLNPFDSAQGRPGEPSTGTTSFLWTALLAAARLLLPDPVWDATLWNLALQAWLAVCVFLLVSQAVPHGAWWYGVAFAAAASCALLGSLVWISLSGMETTLFLALGLTAVWCRTRGQPLASGILMGLLVLTRPEGLALPLAMAVLELTRLRRRGHSKWATFQVPRNSGLACAVVAVELPPSADRPRAWLKLFAPVAFCAVVYFTINLATTGHLLTSTYAGRRWLAGQPAHVDLGPLAVCGRLVRFADAWVIYLHRWVFGMVLLGAWLGVPGAEVWAAAIGVGVALLALIGLHSSFAIRHSSLPLLALWALIHNAAYVVMLPVHGHAGRYQAVNFVLLAILATLGAARLARARGPLRAMGLSGLGVWLVLCVGSAALWRDIYRDSVDHINTVHVACGRWIASNLPSDAVVATYDLGAISYFAERRIVDLGGLVDPAMARYLFAGDVAPYLRQKGATHIALVQHEPGDMRMAQRLGLLPPSPGRPRLRFLRLWGISPERYRLHHPATSNAAPIVALYELDWR